MNKLDDLELKIVKEDTRDNPSSKQSPVIGDARALVRKPVDGIRQYIPSDALHVDEFGASSNESKFQTLLGRVQFSHGPDSPRSTAVIDLLLTIFCFAAVHLVYLGHLDLSSHRTIALLGSQALMMLCLSSGGMYRSKGLRSLNKELTNLVLCWMCAFAAVGLFAFLTKTAEEVSRVWITTSMVFSLISLAGIRALMCFGFMATRNSHASNIVICGDEYSVKTVIRSLYKLSSSRVRVAKVFEFPVDQTGSSEIVEASAQQIHDFIEDQRQSGAAIEQVWIAASTNQAKVVEEVAESLTNSSVDVCVVPDQYTERLLKGEITRYGNTEIVNVSEISLSLAADQFKRVFDIVVASLGLLVIWLPMLIIACLIKIESRGPALFRQKRYGVDGREIEVLKFRSMKVHTDNEVRQATKDDSRVTRLGRILRSTSLDELPQLINVLNGSMSLVGPRPHAVAHNELWRSQIRGYMLRHKVRPGITGLAQVNGWRGETDTVFKMQQRVTYDLEYIRNWSPWMDVKIIVMTVLVGLRHKNAY